MKNASVNNTIKFIDKKAEYEEKHKISKLHINKLSDEHKVIGYQEHKKIKTHEIRRKKFLNSSIYRFRKKIFAITIVTLSLFICIYLWKTLIYPSYIQSNHNNFQVENENLSNSDVSTYSSIIKESVQSTLNIKYKVNIDQIHKNGNLIFSKGHFTIPDKGDINFDIILQNYSPYSLTVNGREYLEK